MSQQIRWCEWVVRDRIELSTFRFSGCRVNGQDVLRITLMIASACKLAASCSAGDQATAYMTSARPARPWKTLLTPYCIYIQ